MKVSLKAIAVLSVLCIGAPSMAQDAAEVPCHSHIAIIGGTYMNDALLKSGYLGEEFTVETPIGPSPTIYCGKANDTEFYYVHGHGGQQREAMWGAFMQLGVTDAIGGATAGAIDPDLKVRDYVVVDDFLDFNLERPRRLPQALFGDEFILARYNPATDPELNEIIAETTEQLIDSRPELSDIDVVRGGTLVQAAGGRFETPAEIRMFATLGGDVVTMNTGSEMAFARQAGINYSAVTLISNPAEGVAEWSFGDLSAIYRDLNKVSVEILMTALPKIKALGGVSRIPADQRIHPELTSGE